MLTTLIKIVPSGRIGMFGYPAFSAAADGSTNSGGVYLPPNSLL